MTAAARRRTSVTIRGDLLDAARRFGINVSALTEGSGRGGPRGPREGLGRGERRGHRPARGLDRGQRSAAGRVAGLEARVVAQFRVYRLPGGRLVLDLQPDVVDIPTRVVAPLEPPSPALRPFTHLEPVFEIEGGRLALHAGELAAVPARLVSGEPVADLRCEDYAIRRALDMLLSGF